MVPSVAMPTKDRKQFAESVTMILVDQLLQGLYDRLIPRCVRLVMVDRAAYPKRLAG
jgi:hypothetical protein